MRRLGRVTHLVLDGQPSLPLLPHTVCPDTVTAWPVAVRMAACP
jgi:hypothetical protein